MSCASWDRGAADKRQFARLDEVLGYIRSEYIAPPDEAALAKAATAGIYRAASVQDSVALKASADPWVDFKQVLRDVLGRDAALNSEKLIDGAITGVVEALDRHSKYTTAAERLAMRDEPRQGAVGLSIQRIENRVIIVDVTADSPAERLQLIKGDRLLEIEGESVDGLLPEAIARRLRGAPGSLVRLTVERKGERFDALAKRSVPTFTGVQSAIHAGKIAYLRVQYFDQSTVKELQKHIARVKSVLGPQLSGVVLDLRNSAGGLLTSVVGVADIFLEDGVILATHGRSKDTKLRFNAGARAGDLKAPVVVLVNGQTAAGSEMLAALLQDRRRARVVGTTTSGLGSIQQIFVLRDGGRVKLTTAIMQRPDGRVLNEAGVIPDVCANHGTLVFLQREQLETTQDARRACPPQIHTYEKESDDTELRAALNMFSKLRTTRADENGTRSAEVRLRLAVRAAP